MHIRLADQPELQLVEAPIAVRRIVTRDQTEKLSVTWMKIDGEHDLTSLGERDAVYAVLSGSGWFQVEGAAPVDVGPGEFFFVPSGTSFAYGGAMEYLNIQSAPPPPSAVRS